MNWVGSLSCSQFPGYIIDHSSINAHGLSPQANPQHESLTVIRRESWEGRGLGLRGVWVWCDKGGDIHWLIWGDKVSKERDQQVPEHSRWESRNSWNHPATQNGEDIIIPCCVQTLRSAVIYYPRMANCNGQEFISLANLTLPSRSCSHATSSVFSVGNHHSSSQTYCFWFPLLLGTCSTHLIRSEQAIIKCWVHVCPDFYLHLLPNIPLWLKLERIYLQWGDLI